MKRSTGLHTILMTFVFLLHKTIGPMLLWEFIFIVIVLDFGCKALIKD